MILTRSEILNLKEIGVLRGGATLNSVWFQKQIRSLSLAHLRNLQPFIENRVDFRLGNGKKVPYYYLRTIREVIREIAWREHLLYVSKLQKKASKEGS